ncbi:hypothetical protein A3L09_09065 [Thermococcus profundus]|uniref:Uncharacterized protein n=1 Tax=Thermococcus profundus TaxID=49899 RepID=A0A2Z2MNB1_THEPR|nr:hypothetical protein [Thermococcus profundus]ASJ03398.1 hypothetical protein A3L09_09065 [Thermococcus profundus]
MSRAVSTIAAVMVLITFIAVPWVQTSYHSYFSSGTRQLGYPELAAMSEDYIQEHVASELSKGTESEDLIDEDGNYTPLARTYILISEALALMPFLVLLGAIIGLWSRWGHVMGIIGMTILTLVMYSIPSLSSENASLTPHAGYILAWLAFILGAAFGYVKKEPQKASSQ